ncbi:hypothetical protein [Pseudophaeobacter sp.]|uniref:hypothetical protein n=1 Tax=Pseudophaeobacter sp. TaxID=1971739 RepID=UPI003297C596
MRDIFIGLFDKLVGVFVIFLCLGVLVGTGVAFVAPAPNGGLLPALGILIGGSIYAIMVGGMMYLFLGVYHNTKRTAEAIEELAKR